MTPLMDVQMSSFTITKCNVNVSHLNYIYRQGHKEDENVSEVCKTEL